MYIVICFLELLGKWYPKEAQFQWCAQCGNILLRCASEACIRHPYLQQILKCQVRKWAWGVQVRWKVRKWESSGCASEAFAVEVWAGIGNWTFSRLYRHAYSKINALGRDLRTPQVSSHSPHRLRNHRAPERAPHTTKSSYSGRGIDFFFPVSTGVLSFETKTVWNLESRIFGLWGRWSSHLKPFWSFTCDRIPCKSVSFELTDDFYQALQQGQRGQVWNFSGMHKQFWMVPGPWWRCQGAHMLNLFSIPFTRELSYSRGVIVLHGLTFYILGYFGCFWFKPGAMSKLCWQKWFFGGRNMCCRQCMCQKKTAFG